MPKSFKEYTEAKDKRVNEFFGWGKKQHQPIDPIPIKNPQNPNPFDKVQNLLLKLSNALQELPGDKYKLNADSMRNFADKIQFAKEKYDQKLANNVGSQSLHPRRDAERAANRQPINQNRVNNSDFDFSKPAAVTSTASSPEFASGVTSRHPRRDAEMAANRQPNSHFGYDRIRDRENRNFGNSFGPSSDPQAAKDRAKRNAYNPNFDWEQQRKDDLEKSNPMQAYRKAMRDSDAELRAKGLLK